MKRISHLYTTIAKRDDNQKRLTKLMLEVLDIEIELNGLEEQDIKNYCHWLCYYTSIYGDALYKAFQERRVESQLAVRHGI